MSENQTVLNKQQRTKQRTKESELKGSESDPKKIKTTKKTIKYHIKELEQNQRLTRHTHREPKQNQTCTKMERNEKNRTKEQHNKRKHYYDTKI